MNALNQIRALAAAGAEVTVACASTRVEMDGVAHTLQSLSAAGIRLPHRALGIQRAYDLHDRRTARFLAAHPGCFDVVHTWPRSATRTLQTARTLGVASLREAPNTHTANALAIDAVLRRQLELPTPFGHSHRFDERLVALEEREYDLADVVIVASEWARTTFVERGVDPNRVAVRPYGFDSSLFKRRERPRDATHSMTAAFVARGEPRKGLHIALGAWHSSGAAAHGRLLLAGFIEDAYRRRLASLINHPSVEERGFVSDVAGLLNEVDVLLLPSFEEGSALVTYEAQACGCALLVSRAAGARIMDGREGLEHEPGDTATLSNQLRLLMSQPETLSAMQNAAAENAVGLTWDRSIARQLAVYEATLESSRPPKLCGDQYARPSPHRV